MQVLPVGDLDELPGVPGIDRERLLAEHVRPRLERGLRMFVVHAVGTRDEADVHARVDHVPIVLARDPEAPVVLDLLEQLRPLAADADELELVLACREVRKMRGDGPGPRPITPSLSFVIVAPVFVEFDLLLEEQAGDASSPISRATSCRPGVTGSRRARSSRPGSGGRRTRARRRARRPARARRSRPRCG